MRLNQDGVVSAVYRLSYRLWRSFMGDNYSEAPRHTDLCSMLRTILIGAPLALIINGLTIAWVLFSVIYLLFAFWLYVSVVGILILIVLSAIILLIVLFYGGKAIATIARAETTREVISVVQTYYSAKKARICPLVDLTGGVQ